MIILAMRIRIAQLERSARTARDAGSPSSDQDGQGDAQHPRGATRSVPAPGTSSRGDQRHPAHPPPVDQNGHRPDALTRRERALELVRRVHARGAARCPSRTVSDDAAARARAAPARRGTSRRRCASVRPRGTTRTRLEAVEAPAQQRERVGVAGGLASARPCTTLITRAPRPARGRAHQHVAGARSCAGLHAVDPRVRGRPGRCGSRPRARGCPTRSVASGVSTIRAKRRFAQQRAGERREVARAGVVARVVEADRVRVAGVRRARARAARSFICSTNASREPAMPSARSPRRRSRSRAAAPRAGRAPSSARPAQVDPRLGRHGVVGRRGEDVAGLRLARATAARSSASSCWRSARSASGRLANITVAVAASTTIAAWRGRDARRRRRGRGASAGAAASSTAASDEHAAARAHSRSLIFWPGDERLRVELGVQLLELLDGDARSSRRSPPSVSPVLTV